MASEQTDSRSKDRLHRETSSGYANKRRIGPNDRPDRPQSLHRATEVGRFAESVETAYRLDPLLELLDTSDDEFDHTLVTDADGSWEVERDRVSLDSGVERVRNADRLRVLDWMLTPSPLGPSPRTGRVPVRCAPTRSRN